MTLKRNITHFRRPIRPIRIMCKEVKENMLAMNEKGELKRFHQGNKNDKNIHMEILRLKNTFTRTF